MARDPSGLCTQRTLIACSASRSSPSGPRAPSRTADASSLAEAVEAGSAGFARVRLGALGPDGEDRLAEHAISVRCLQRPDGSLAGEGDAEEDLVAVVGRSY